MVNEKRIIETAEKLFIEMGLGFTLDDISKQLHIAKKTIYKSFPSKEELMIAMIDNGFEKIQANKKEILESDLPYTEKLRTIMIAMPDTYSVFDFRELETLHDKYPAVYQCLQKHLESNWQPVIDLLEQGKNDGTLNDFSIPILKVMITSTLEAFLSTNDLKEHKISYTDALNKMMDIIMKGIVK